MIKPRARISRCDRELIAGEMPMTAGGKDDSCGGAVAADDGVSSRDGTGVSDRASVRVRSRSYIPPMFECCGCHVSVDRVGLVCSDDGPEAEDAVIEVYFAEVPAAKAKHLHFHFVSTHAIKLPHVLDMHGTLG